MSSKSPGVESSRTFQQWKGVCVPSVTGILRNQSSCPVLSNHPRPPSCSRPQSSRFFSRNSLYHLPTLSTNLYSNLNRKDYGPANPYSRKLWFKALDILGVPTSFAHSCAGLFVLLVVQVLCMGYEACATTNYLRGSVSANESIYGDRIGEAQEAYKGTLVDGYEKCITFFFCPLVFGITTEY